MEVPCHRDRAPSVEDVRRVLDRKRKPADDNGQRAINPGLIGNHFQKALDVTSVTTPDPPNVTSQGGSQIKKKTRNYRKIIENHMKNKVFLGFFELFG